jgi:hypothetical protein
MINRNTMDQLYQAFLDNWPIVLIVLVFGGVAVALLIAITEKIKRNRDAGTGLGNRSS